MDTGTLTEEEDVRIQREEGHLRAKGRGQKQTWKDPSVPAAGFQTSALQKPCGPRERNTGPTGDTKESLEQNEGVKESACVKK